MIKIAHIADIHLRQRQYGSYARGEDFLAGLLSALETAHKHGANVVLASGDILDSTNPGAPVCITQLDKVQEFLVANEMRMYAISGNHDKTSPSWCSRFTGETGIIAIDHKKVDCDGITIVGIPYMSGPELRAMLENKELESGDILMWHGDVAELAGFPPEGAITAEELTKDKLWQVIALGHIHIHQKLNKNGVVVTYPGSTEKCDSADESEKKMFMYTFDKGKLKKTESIGFKTREVQEFEVHTEEELQEAINNFSNDSIIFIKYAKNIKNAMLAIRAAAHEGNLVRSVPLSDKSKRATDVANREQVLDPVSFVKVNMVTMVGDKDKADRILGLTVAALSPEADFVSALDMYCEDRLNSVEI